MHLALPADELAAWGQLAGALFTLIAVVVALWVAIHDVRRREREDQERRDAQALTVVARVETFHNDEATAKPGFYWPQSWQAVVIENFGPLPVTNVVIHGVAGNVGSQHVHRWVLLDNEDKRHDDQTDYFLCTVLGPGVAERTPTLVFKDLSNEAEQRRISTRTAAVRFSFRAADGSVYQRVGSLTPERVK